MRPEDRNGRPKTFTAAELMAEELRRLDEDEVYAEAVRSLTKRQDTEQEKRA